MIGPVSKVTAIVAVIALAGCSMLPGSGPREPMIRQSAAADRLNTQATVGFDYVMVDVTRSLLPLLTQDPQNQFQTFGTVAGGTPSLRLGPGDVIRVTVFESQTGGLFLPEDAGARPGNFVQLPPQRIDQEGRITVPFAGVITAAGQTPAALERVIRERLLGRAIEPEISVEIVEQNFSRVSILGAVGGAGVFPLREGGVRILEAIASAGGLTIPATSTFVILQRGSRTAKVAFQAILDSPRENIFLAPGDVIEVVQEERQFFAFGATGLVGRFAFGASEVTLNEAVARVASLQDGQADPRNVLIYRREARHALERIGVDMSEFPSVEHQIPTIFRANYRSPDIFFLANEFQMRDGDVIFVTNAASVAIQRFFNTATTLTGGPLAVRDNIRSF